MLEEIRRVLQDNGDDRLMAYNAKFDFNHLPEFSDYTWCDIMKLASNRNYNDKIPSNVECHKNGRMKKGYGVENILRMLLGNRRYIETHNAFYDAVDELKIVQLLGHNLEVYDDAIINVGNKKSNKTKTKPAPKINLQPDYDPDIPNRGPSVSKSIGFGTCSAEEAARILGVSKSTVYKLIKTGQLYAKKRSNKYEISISSVNEYFERKRRAVIVSLAISAGAVALLFLFFMFLL